MQMDRRVFHTTIAEGSKPDCSHPSKFVEGISDASAVGGGGGGMNKLQLFKVKW